MVYLNTTSNKAIYKRRYPIANHWLPFINEEIRNWQKTGVIKIAEVNTHSTRKYFRFPKKSHLEKKRFKNQANYDGPFKIHAKTERNNYALMNLDGELLTGTFDVIGLKPTSSDFEISKDIHVVKKNLDHKKIANKTFYFLKWKDLSDSKNS
ncbi:hypothetical protein BB561_004459 [Smittium simulii]|uniref:Chromo domain-containing protein n=1 Tax=Smittium simulii TaxID=133385 RepID=A0A2T9YG54_9FUNG|nr:hypothetical protein BB561_004459 [Smittium simulii]